MGYNLYLKQACKRPLEDECISGASCYQKHDVDDESYLSFNFSRFSDYWHVRKGHGHSGRVVAIQLRAVIERLENEVISCDIPYDGDEWTPTINVFHYHMKRLLRFVDGYPDATFLSDQIRNIEHDDNDTDYEDNKDGCEKDAIDLVSDQENTSINSIGDNGSFVKSFDGNSQFDISNSADDKDNIIHKNLSNLPKSHGIVTYYQHPIRGNIKVYNFAIASEVFAIASINGDPQAHIWLEIARAMPDAPK